MADITSKAAMAPVTPKATDKPQASTDGGGLGGFSSLPSSIHHGLSEKLQGLTEKLQQLGMVSKNVNNNYFWSKIFDIFYTTNCRFI